MGEKMSGFTKEIIIKTLFELLNEKPLAKITVKDIVERCGVNRNTFYYHFRDISDVVEYALLRDVDKAFSRPVEVDSFLDCLEVLVNQIGVNKKAMLHIYCSIQREIMEKEDMKVLMHFYKCVMTGVILDWLDHRMSYDLVEYAGRLRQLHGNNFEKTLENAAGTKPALLKIM